MAIPLNAVVWDQPMDPADIIDYQADFRDGQFPVLEATEVITAFVPTLPADAVALGVEIMSGGGYDPTSEEGDTSVKVWFKVDSGYQLNPAYDGEGQNFGVMFHITTDNAPAREREKTYVLTVAQQ